MEKFFIFILLYVLYFIVLVFTRLIKKMFVKVSNDIRIINIKSKAETKKSLNNIKEMIQEIYHSVGIKENINIEEEERLIYFVSNKKYQEAIKMIARQLNLPITVNLIKVASDQRENLYLQHKESKDSKEAAEIIAEVFIPKEGVPMYGSKELEDYPITVRIKDNCLNYPWAFGLTIAHELSHVLLNSLHIIKRDQLDNEILTDLTAMMLGFNFVFMWGRKHDELRKQSVYRKTYGYLSDLQFDFAYKTIESMLRDERKKYQNWVRDIEITIESCNRLMEEYKLLYSKFQEYKEVFSKYRFQNIADYDLKKIVSCFQPDYDNEIMIFIEKYTEEIKENNIIYNKYKNISYYNSRAEEEINNFIEKLKKQVEYINNKINLLQNDLQILEKYIKY
jgi:hypothetical protein